jgi:hypothetical protein
VNEKRTAKTTDDLQQNTRKNCPVNIDFLQHVFRITAFRILKKMPDVSTLSIRTGTAEDRLLGPTFFHHARVSDFLRNVLPEPLQYVHLQNRIHLWIVHDGDPPYFLVALMEFMNNLFPKRRTGHSGPTAWPVPSTDLSPLFFYISGNISNLQFMPKLSVTSRTCDKQAQST